MKFNWSYSTMATYKKNPRLFYYQQIVKIPPPDKTIQVYGMAGNSVHTYLENYIKNKSQKEFIELWREKGLDQMEGFNGKPLNFLIYKNSVDFGIRKINAFKSLGYNIESERKFLIKYNDFIDLKGFVDVIFRKTGKTIFADWKTSSKKVKGEFDDQMLFYDWLYWEETGEIIDKNIWYYNKIGKEASMTMSLKKIKEFKQQQEIIIKEIINKGKDINKYPINEDEIDNPFNGYASLMKKSLYIPTILPITSPIKKELIITIEKAKLFLSGKILTEDLIKNLSIEFSYELKDSFFIKKAMGKKGVEFDGIKKFYSIKNNSLPIGFLPRLERYLNKKEIVYKIIDNRYLLRHYKMPKQLINIKLRDYQQRAVDFTMENKISTLELTTASGKTVIAAEIIRQNEGLTLFIVDRQILLEQTKKEFESMLGLEIGTITKGKIDLKTINVATIQTLNSMIKSKDEYLMKILSNIKTLLIDENHSAAAQSYINVCNYIYNADIRIGLTGTYKRPDGNEMMIESIVGKNDFIIEANELNSKGHIMVPNIWFIKYPSPSFSIKKEYSEMYKDLIVNNETRNKTALEIINRFINNKKKILILTSEIDHGTFINNQIKDSAFIHGSIDDKIREQWLNEMKYGDRQVIIGTSSIIQKGLNIKNLDVVINLTGNDSHIVTLQSLGRALRTNEGKSTCYYIDFYDTDKYYFLKHTQNRIKTLKEKGYKIDLINHFLKGEDLINVFQKERRL